MLLTGLIETLSEDRASMLQEKKHLEEELNRLRTGLLISSAFFSPATGTSASSSSSAAAAAATAASSSSQALVEPAGAVGGEMPLILQESDPERLASVACLRDDERVDSAVDASMMATQ